MGAEANPVFGICQTEHGTVNPVAFSAMSKKNEPVREEVARVRATLAKAVRHNMDNFFVMDPSKTETQRAIELGERSGMGKTTIIEILNCTRDAGIDKVARLARIFRVDVEHLLSRRFAPSASELKAILTALNTGNPVAESKPDRGSLQRRAGVKPARSGSPLHITVKGKAQ